MKPKIFTNKDKSVFKMIHKDGTETVIKDSGSCNGASTYRNRYSIFLSSFYGCTENCTFCMLNSKGIKYKRTSKLSSFENAQSAISHYAKINPSIRNKYAKISWMGMGEPLKTKNKIITVTTLLQEWIIENKFASSIHSTDVSTSLPFSVRPEHVIQTVQDIQIFSSYDVDFRLFISLGSVIPETRNFMIGYHQCFKRDVECIVDEIYPIIFHTFFLDGINDSHEEIDEVISFFNEPMFQECELRILRYNECDNSLFTESTRYEQIKHTLNASIPNIKFQPSPGKEMMAACGQFL